MSIAWRRFATNWPSSALTSKRQSLDTARSALTGRHPPAAREHSHLFWSESCACAPSFSLVSAGYRRFLKGGVVTTPRILPVRPSLESLRKQAKKLARDIAAGDVGAIARARVQLPNVEPPL